MKWLVGVAVLVAMTLSACGSGPKTVSGSSTPPTRVALVTHADTNRFCALLGGDQATFNSAKAAATTALQLKQVYENLETALDEVRSSAPMPIRADFGAFVASFTGYISAEIALNYDHANLQAGAVQASESAAAKAATDRVDGYLEQTGCKVQV